MFIQELVKQAKTNDKIVLIVGDLGYSVIEPFSESYPDRFINAGVSEQNMTGLAAGMASEGYHVFTYSIANFPTFRCAEQIRNDVDYHHLPVTIVSVGGGVSYGSLGYSHHAVQDYSLIRSMPNMLISSPGDPLEVRACMTYLIKNPQPSYLRLGKAGEPVIHHSEPLITPGKWVLVKAAQRKNNDSKKTALISTGATLEIAFHLCQQEEWQDVDLYTIPLWGQGFKKNQESFSQNYDSIHTLEDHLIDGGFGSWLMESLVSSRTSGKVYPHALSSDVCGTVGSQQTLNKLGGLINFSR
jgi:transketolase